MPTLINSFSLSSVIGIGTDTPNESLTVVGNISATGALYGDGSGLTNLPGGEDTEVRALTGNWQDTFTTVSSNSGSWTGGNEAYTNLVTNSASYISTPVYGTIEQIVATPGANNSVTLSLPNSIVTPGDLNVTGSLFVNGSAANINTLNLSLSDTLIYLGEGNISNVVDIGFVGNYTPTPSAYQHTGLVRVARDNKWTLFSGVTAEPTTVVDFSGNYIIDTLRANIEGTLFGNVSGDVSGNAGSVTNGVYTNAVYTDPTWITSLADTKITGSSRDNWDSTTAIVQANSATTWNYQGEDLKALSGNWQDTYTSWNSASATSIVSFNDTRFVKLSSQSYTFDPSVSSIDTVNGVNIASGVFSSVLGGNCNTSSSNYSIINSGLGNHNPLRDSVISGGVANRIGGLTPFNITAASSISGNGTQTRLNGTCIQAFFSSPFTANNVSVYYSTPSIPLSAGCFITATVAATGSNFIVINGDYSTCTASGLSANNIYVYDRAINNTGQSNFIGGGKLNTASGCYATIGGGFYNRVVPSVNNVPSCFTTIGGGCGNTASAYFATIAGGQGNSAQCKGSVAGGQSNSASGYASFVGGGQSNTSGGRNSAIVGGSNNSTTGGCTFIGAGGRNCASGNCSAIVGGQCNTTSGVYTTITGGLGNFNPLRDSIIGGGVANRTGGFAPFNITSTASISGNGSQTRLTGTGIQSCFSFPFATNNVSVYYSTPSIPLSAGCFITATVAATGSNFVVINGDYSTCTASGLSANCIYVYDRAINNTGYDNVIAGGKLNTASGCYTSVLGGFMNRALGCFSFIGGGACNNMNFQFGVLNPASVIVGGQNNSTCASNSFIGGGSNNLIGGTGSAIVGGGNNTASTYSGFIGGGNCNRIFSGPSGNNPNAGVIAGGDLNIVCSVYSAIGGGSFNQTYANYSVIGGGGLNRTGALARPMCTTSNLISGVGGNCSWLRFPGDVRSCFGTPVGSCALFINYQSNSIPFSATNAVTTPFWYHSCNYDGQFTNILVGQDFSTNTGGVSANTLYIYNRCLSTLANVSVIGGGKLNTTSSNYTSILGGRLNTASANYASILGGCNNIASGRSASVGGGACNTASGTYSFVAGGSANDTRGFANTFILGTNLSASQANFTYVNNLSSQGAIETAILKINTAPSSFINPLTASNSFLIVNVDGVNKALQLWDYTT